MISWTDLTGLASAALLIATAVTALAMRLGLRQRRILAALAIALSVLPLGDISLAALVRGIVGDLSVTSVLLLALTLAQGWAIPAYICATPERIRSYRLWSVAALLLYPAALGIGLIDPYRWGYGEMYFLLALLGVAALAYRWQLRLVVWSVMLAIAAWTVGWYESSNLWDYLIDPWLSVLAMATLLVRAIKKFRVRNRA